jgi:Spy/CpxP family protein refolding chaperone
MNWKKTATAAAIALGVVGAAGFTQPIVQSAQAHQGMMGSYGTGSANGWGYGGYHMGPGMMGGYGGYGGYGMGPGMMSGYGGYGLGTIYRLDLTADQHKQLDGIQDDLRKKNWDLMGKMQDEMSKLGNISSAPDKQDRTAILAANKRMFELRQQMLENGLDAQDKAEALLTPQQKEQYRKLAQSRFDNDD